MARTKKQIKEDITKPFMANQTLATKYGFTVGDSFDNQFSLVSLENILFEIMALAMYVHELFFDQHTTEINQKLATQKTGTLSWYRTMALQFQYNSKLVKDRDYYDNSTATDEQIKASKIIKYAAVNEAKDGSRVILKIAGEKDGTLTEFIEKDEIDAIEFYINQIRVAGVQVTIINYKADLLYLNLEIKRDPLLLNDKGMKLGPDGGGYPVTEALNEFMKELNFNGELRLSALVDKLQLVPGVLDATVTNASSAWIDPKVNDYGQPVPFSIFKIAESGYFKIHPSNTIRYVV